MRHNKKFNHLGRTSSHRKAMLANMCVSLIMSPNKRIFTTVAKAKALRKVIEPIVTKAKEDTTHSRRLVFQDLKINSDKTKAVIAELFQNVAQKVADRPGGYTRIIKTGNRLGDNASMCFIELVDYDENMQKEKRSASKGRTRRSKKSTDQSLEISKKVEAEKVEKENVEEVDVLETAPESLPVTDEAVTETPAAEEEKPKTDE
ncbi:MAG: 50S ribosomal protein L17 [Prevotella sp.]|jgi:large subunit ribosomal protein L17|nr:50S ribosomal protein L17 [Prevotella sp.]